MSPPNMRTPLRYSFTGLYGDKNAGCGSLVDCYVDIKLTGLHSQITSRILFHNTTKHDFEDAIYYARVADGARITSVDCLIEREPWINRRSNHAGRLDRRVIRNANHEESFFRCNLGKIESDQEVVVFLRYNHDAVVHDNTATIRIPLPGRTGERLITRQGNGIMDWNGSRMFSFMALDIEASMPGQIASISSKSHLISSTIQENTAKVEIEDHILLGQDDLQITIEAEGLQVAVEEEDTQIYHVMNSRTRQPSLYSGTTEGSLPFDTVFDNDWQDEQHEMQYENSMLFDKYIMESPTMYEDAIYMDNQESDKTVMYSAPMIYRTAHYFDDTESRYDGRAMSSFLMDDDEDCDDDFEFPNDTSHQLDTPVLPCAGKIWYGTPEGKSWYEEGSEDESSDAAERRDSAADVFHDCNQSMENESSQKEEEDEDDDDDEWDTEPPTTATAQSPLSYFDSVFVGTALAVSPGRPRLVQISPRSSIAGSDDELSDHEKCKSERDEIAEIMGTPPMTPVGRGLHTPTFGLDSAWSAELWSIVTSFTNQIKRSANTFLNLNDEFADVVGVPLHILSLHTGAQAYNLPQVAKWIREGIWANVLAIHFLQTVMDCDELAEWDVKFQRQLAWLFYCLENPLVQQERKLLGSAIDYALSLTELTEMAKEVFEEVAEMEGTTGILLKELDPVKPPLSAPVSPTTVI